MENNNEYMINVGDKFYRLNADDASLDLRVMRVQNPTTFKCKRGDGQYVKIKKSDLDKYYRRINAHGSLYISCVINSNKEKDVLGCLYRTKDCHMGEQIEPWLIFRQNINDIHAECFNNMPFVYNFGLCVTQLSIFEGMNMYGFLKFEDLIDVRKINVYLDDDVNSILELIDNKFMNKTNEILKELSDNAGLAKKGYCETLKQLLEEQQFLHEFRLAWDIETVSFEVTEENTKPLEPDHLRELESIVGKQMLNTMVFSHDYSFSVDKIQRKFKLIADSKSEIYAIAYDEGDYMTQSHQEALEKLKNDRMDIVEFVKKEVEQNEQA